MKTLLVLQVRLASRLAPHGERGNGGIVIGGVAIGGGICAAVLHSLGVIHL
jgi:hypothetical protein